MTSQVKRLAEKQLIRPPSFVPENVQYEVITGSYAYGVSGDTSDQDIIGFCIPDKQMLFPHTIGYIDGFGNHPEKFKVWTQHHIKEEEKEFDFSIYNIVQFFHLCMGCNPNMIDVLYVPQRCVRFMTPVGDLVRKNREIFLSKHAYNTFHGYARQQLHALRVKKRENSEKRKEVIEKFGYDTKNAYHIVRLALEAEQILMEGTLQLDANSDILKSIREGAWSLNDLEDWFLEKVRQLEGMNGKSTLRHKPDEGDIKNLLMDCLEQHFGTLKDCVVRSDKAVDTLRDLYIALTDAKYKGIF